jgi:hypothetical protein
MQLLPNPSSGLTNVLIGFQNSFSGELLVSNMMGETVYQQNLNLPAGQSSVQLNLAYLASGIYLVRVNDATASKTLKFLKEQG